MKILIGSRALKHHGSEYLSKAKRTWDTDWIGSYPDYEEYKNSLSVKKLIPLNKGKKVALFEPGGIHEFEIAWSDSVAAELLEIAKQDESVAVKHGDDYIATPDLIFTLKKSHRYLKNSPHFMKTMLDYRHLRDAGCKVPDSLSDWYKKRVEETYNYKHPSLKQNKKNFFKDDMVPYKYDHDTLHLAVKALDRPAYDYFKKNTAEVECSRELFEACDERTRLLSVLEESYVLALERSQIPAPGVITPKQSFMIALMKVCTSITSGWWREFAYENYFKVLDMYSDEYMDRFNAGLESGIVKPFEGSEHPHD